MTARIGVVQCNDTKPVASTKLGRVTESAAAVTTGAATLSRSQPRRALIALTPTVIAITTMLGYFYTPNNGLLAAVFRAIGMPDMAKFPWLGPDTIFAAMMIGITWIEVGFYLVLLLAGVDKIPPDFFESAKLDGANQVQQFWHITVPLLWDVIVIGLVLWSIYAVKIFEFPFSFTGLEPNPNSYTVAVYSYILGFGQRQPIYRLGYATAVGVMLLLVVILIVLVIRWLTRREVVQY